VTTPPALVRYYDVPSADGTRLRAWTNDADGPTVLVCNGLGANPHAWPSLLQPDCGVRVISWNHRGTSGSERPRDGRVDLDAFIEDALAVLDHAGVESCAVASWSAGVTVAFELAARYPERVSAILAVAGVPGNTFGTMLEPLHVPGWAAKPLMTTFTRAASVAGPLLAPWTTRIPWTTTTANVVRSTRFVNPAASARQLRDLLQEFCTTDPAWYATLALGVSQQPRVSLSRVDVPVTFVSATWDVFTGAGHMHAAAKRVAKSRYRQVRGTHFVPLEHPGVILDELLRLSSATLSA
jgi:3-oxoadipate enol-lactonase